MKQKTASSIKLETVIKSIYYRGTTQIDLCPLSRVLTYAYSFHFRPPSKVHSELKSIRQSHRLPLSVISFKTYSSFSSVFAFDVSYSSCPGQICQGLFSLELLCDAPRLTLPLPRPQVPALPAASRQPASAPLSSGRMRPSPSGTRSHHGCCPASP